jgi:phospholipid transport system transporter-binding protein
VLNRVSFEKINEHQVKITGELSFASVSHISNHELAFLNRDHLILDLAGIDYSDSAGLALLLDWLKKAKAKKQHITFINPLPQMKAIAHICGLDEILGF